MLRTSPLDLGVSTTLFPATVFGLSRTTCGGTTAVAKWLGCPSLRNSGGHALATQTEYTFGQGRTQDGGFGVNPSP